MTVYRDIIFANVSYIIAAKIVHKRSLTVRHVASLVSWHFFTQTGALSI